MIHSEFITEGLSEERAGLVKGNHRLGTLNPFCQQFQFAVQKGLERSNAFLSASDALLRESITKLPFPPGALLAGFTQ